MPSVCFSLPRALTIVAASLVFGSSTAFAASIIGTRTSSITFSIDSNRTAYIAGLSASEASSVTEFNYLSVIRPYDAEKTGINDTQHCWAATSANMLAYSGWGNVNGFQTEDDIFSYISSNFTDFGGNMNYANEWFFYGVYNAPLLDDWAQLTTVGGGGFWAGTGIDYGYVATYSSGAAGLNSLLYYLQNDYAVGLSIGWYGAGDVRNYGHAVTAWGATYDNVTGNLVSLLVSDSDNHYGQGRNAPDTLNELFLVYNENGNYYSFSNPEFQTGRLEGFDYLAAIPEPPTYLLFGIGLIGMIVMRRRVAR